MCCDVVVCVLVQFAGIMVALLMLVLPKVIFYLPSAVLSSMIIVAVGGLIDYKTAMRLWHQDRPDFLVRIGDVRGVLSLPVLCVSFRAEARKCR